jgi:CRISPR-associated protein Csm3
MAEVKQLIGKLMIEAKMELKTGMHIGKSSDFSPIGAVDTVIVRDPVTLKPMVPGSSMKGKMRYLLSRVYATKVISDFAEEDIQLKRLFGSSQGEEGIILSRLQFHDLFLTKESVEKLSKMDLDLPYAEIKFENTISRTTSVANPRQLERVPKGAIFQFKLTYNIEDINEMKQDLQNIRLGLALLSDDYIGGHGTRGYGRVMFNQISVIPKIYAQEHEADVQANANQFSNEEE